MKYPLHWPCFLFGLTFISLAWSNNPFGVGMHPSEFKDIHTVAFPNSLWYLGYFKVGHKTYACFKYQLRFMVISPGQQLLGWSLTKIDTQQVTFNNSLKQSHQVIRSYGAHEK